MDQKTFDNFPEVDLLKGFELCINNCNSHFKCAQEIERIEEYGIANSHLVLSSEEGIKALLFLCRILGIDLSELPISPFFKKHAPKHQAARQLYWEFKYSNYINQIVIDELKKNIIEYVINDNGKLKVDEDKYRKDFIRESALKNRQIKIQQWRSNWDKEDRELKWWNKADYYKNRGFYVNYNNSKWESPSEITKEIYFDSKAIVSNIINFINEHCSLSNIEGMKDHFKFMENNKIELFDSAPNGTQFNKLVLTETPNIDGSGVEYIIEHIDFISKEKLLVGRCDLDSGHVRFAETTDVMGIPIGAIKLLVEWMEKNSE